MIDGMQALLAGMERLDIPWMLGGSVGAMC